MELIKTTSASELEASFFSANRLETDGGDSSVAAIVAEIISAVRQGGDKAIHDYSKKFDRASPEALLIPRGELEGAKAKLQKQNPKLYDALCLSRDLAERFALKQKESFTDFEVELRSGLMTGQKTIAVEHAGIYVPAGRFPLLSSVVMCITPAKVAGCAEVVLCTPPREHPADAAKPCADEGIMAAAAICGATKVFACGGAQAVAAMAYGTESIPRCDVIAGPGNKYVAEAKRMVYGQCGIDMLAGPTEVMIVADGSARADWVAADMLAQAEHDVVAQAVLVTTSPALAEAVKAELEKQLQDLPTEATARQSLARYGRIILAKTLDEAAEIANRKAPEHLELALDAGVARDGLASAVHNYGSLFVGHEAAEVLGDYAAGLNHTLPTNGWARFTGGLSVRCFLKTVTTLRASDAAADGYKASLAAANALGTSEGLEAHARAARVRM